MNAVRRLEELGQSIWYDNISRALINGGELEQLVNDGLLGVTSNPTIFEKAISGSADYDPQVGEILSLHPDLATADVIRALMVRDIQMATDVLLPVFERTAGRDGYVSVEVTPSKARNTAATLEEVRQIWSTVRRKNVMIKIPATKEGLPAITQAIGDGYNVNVTLIFSVERYREVAEAYIQGLEHRAEEGRPLGHVASVASVFVSRVDTLTDDLLQKKIAETKDGAAAARLNGLRGKAAVANTKLIYQAFREIFEGPRFAAMKAKGARVQRPLWASTGTKNPAYSDLLYVDTLIGPHTVNTVPPATYAALLDHLKPALTVESDLAGAHEVLRDLAEAGIDIGQVMKKLEEDGVAAFEKSFDGLYANLESKKARLTAGTTLGPR
jgi:transaldolase